jgi:hypothetical protein
LIAGGSQKPSWHVTLLAASQQSVLLVQMPLPVGMQAPGGRVPQTFVLELASCTQLKWQHSIP